MKPSISWRKQKAQRRLVAESRGQRVALARARRFREEPVPKRRLTLREEVLVDGDDLGSAQQRLVVWEDGAGSLTSQWLQTTEKVCS